MDLFMSVDELFDVNVWYMTMDYQDLYAIEKNEFTYQVIRFGDWKPMFSGTKLECKLYLLAYCRDHTKYKNTMYYV